MCGFGKSFINCLALGGLNSLWDRFAWGTGILEEALYLCMVFKFQFEMKAAVANTSSNG